MVSIPQEGALFPHLNVRENVALGLPPKTGKEARGPQVDAALETARIGHVGDRSVQTLSGGEQQRVALARALVQRPPVLLLDEPFHSLDGPLKRKILSEVRDLVRDENIATILVTHDIDEAATFADRVVLLRAGRKIQEGTFQELYAHPADQETADFLGPVESIEVEQALHAQIEVPQDEPGPLLCFRREHLWLLEDSAGEPGSLEITEARPLGMIPAKLVEISKDDSKVKVYVVPGDEERTVVRESIALVARSEQT